VRILQLGLSLGITGTESRWLRDWSRFLLNNKWSAIMADTQLLLFASELRTRAKEILVRAASADDPEARGMMRVLAAGYEKLARRMEQRVRETVDA